MKNWLLAIYRVIKSTMLP